MIDNGEAEHFMLKIETCLITLASIDCAIRWSNLFSMRLSLDIFVGLILLQSFATVLLLIGVGSTIWQLWIGRTASKRLIRSWSKRSDLDMEGAGADDPGFYVLCEIPIRRRRLDSSEDNDEDNTNNNNSTDKNLEAGKTKRKDENNLLQIRAKREIWFTAASALIEDFVVPCVFWLLYENNCEAYLAAGGNSWFDIAEAAVGSMAALFVWLVVSSLMMRMATLTRKRQFASKMPFLIRWMIFGIFFAVSILCAIFSLCQGFMMGLFLSTECPQKLNETSIVKASTYHWIHHHQKSTIQFISDTTTTVKY